MTSSSSKTFEDSLMGHISSLLSAVIMPAVVDYYKEQKGVECSVDELMHHLDITPSSPSALIPPVVKSTSRSKGDSQNSEALQEKPKPGQGCVYMFVRGNNKGKYCGKTCFPGLNYCKWCKGKKEAQKDIKNGGVNSSLRQKSSSDKRGEGSSTGSSKKQESSDTLNVHQHPVLEDHYIYEETNFILKEQDDVVYVIARQDEEGFLHTLTDEEKLYSKKLKLTPIDNEDEEEDALAKLRKLLGQDKGKEAAEDEIENIPTSTDPMISHNTSNIPILPTIPPVPGVES